uniref:Aftiphilin n=1 Tax=Callorhinchus milii TaxID=7868 RepID=A0A4W3J4J4_CALMI
MEPEVIRIYSSSPPPLDDGNGFEEDDEFGEFGGFSGTSSLGFTDDFDSKHHPENSMPQNHFVPGHEYSTDADGFADLPTVSIGTSKDVTQHKLSKGVFDAPKEETKESIKEPGLDSLTKDNVSRNMEPEKPEECCNGSKTHTEILTNGYPTLDSINPQETKDIDSISGLKEQRARSVHSTELSDSTPSPTEDFAEFSAFSKTEESVHLSEENPSKFPLHVKTSQRTEHHIGKCSHFGKFTDMQFSPSVVMDSDEVNVVQQTTEGTFAALNCKNGKSASTDVNHTKCHSSGFTAAVDTDISNGKWNSSESTGYIETRQQSSQQSVHEALDTVKENHTTGSIETDPNPHELESKRPDAPEPVLETCTSDQEMFGDFAESLVSSESGVKQEHTSFQENASADTGRTEFVNLESNCLAHGDVMTSFGPVSSSDAVEDGLGTFDVHPVELDDNNTSKLSVEPLAKVQEMDVKDEFGDFSGMNSNDAQAFENSTESRAANEVTLEGSEPDASRENENQFDDRETVTTTVKTDDDDDDFGDFGSIQEPKVGTEFASFKSDATFSDFSSSAGEPGTEWNAFGETVGESTSWAAFGEDQVADAYNNGASEISRTEPALSGGTQLTGGWTNTTPAESSEGSASIKDTSPFEETAPMSQASLLNRLERVFQACFPPVAVLEAEEEISSLRQLLEPANGKMKGEQATGANGELLTVWTELQDVNDAHGLKYQWGGSHSNKKLLCSLGIDTRNILFTGQKKQPVIVPAYASGLGMLEPTKEPLKPISAAEKIASIGQTPTASASSSEMSTCTSDQTQEHVPPVQFDWSSSGLTNPLDANGGSTVLNLDFFGPMDDTSSSNSATIPGVDPELYELTTSKLESSSTVNRMTDAFARLMSTAEKTSTSTRKPKKDEVLSTEAAKVIANLPDLLFMHAKVLMFPATLTPLVRSQEKAD